MTNSVQLDDLTTGPLARQIWRFSLPLMFSNLLQVLFNMADIAVVGRFAGSLALGSVGSTAILVSLFTGILIGLGSGVNALVARAFGAKNDDAVRDYTHASAIVCPLVGFVVMGIALVTARPILELLGTKPELIDGAELYLYIYYLGMPALAVYNHGSGVLSAIGETKKPLWYLGAAGIVNIILNLIFVIGFHMDVAGVALASIISQYLSAALITGALMRAKGSWRLELRGLAPAKWPGYARISLRVLALGIPAGLQNGIFMLANLFVQAGVNTFDATMVAGNSAASNADGIVYNIMAAFYTAGSSFIGQNYGAGKKRRILASFWLSTLYAFFVALVIGLALVFAGEVFLAMFTEDPAVIDAGMKKLVIMGCSYCISAFMDAPIAASRGLGKSALPTFFVIMGSCVFRIIWVKTVFAHFGTIPSLYLLYAFSWTITAAAEIWYFFAVYRKKCREMGE